MLIGPIGQFRFCLAFKKKCKALPRIAADSGQDLFFYLMRFSLRNNCFYTCRGLLVGSASFSSPRPAMRIASRTKAIQKARPSRADVTSLPPEILAAVVSLLGPRD